MKTTPLYCSAVIIVALTVFFGSLKPPRIPVAEARQIQAVETPQVVQTVVTAPEPEKAPEPPEIKPPEPIQPEPRKVEPPVTLTNHQELMQQAGIPEAEWAAAEDIIAKESGWCATKWEGEYGGCPEYHGVPESAGYGLCQATPAHKMASIDADWATNPVKQLQWCHQYVQAYGGWWPAKKFRDCTGSCYSPRTNNVQYKKTTWF